MAKKKGGGKRAAKAETVNPADTMLMPTTNDIVNLDRGKRSARKQVGEINDNFTKRFAEKKHVDRRAFNIVANLNALSDEQLQITYFHLLRYMDDLEIPKRATAQEEMFEEGAEAGEGKPRVVAGRDTEETAGEAASA
jgi:hypothetical protein